MTAVTVTSDKMQKHPLKLQELNSHLVCDICSGYLIDATTIVECLHSFCRSCLVRHIERNACCPSCDAPLPKAKPFLHIRSDKTLQDIVYKLVPGLYHREMQRRRDFYAKHPDEAWRASPEERGTAMERLVFSPQDQFSLSLEYSSKPQSSECCRNEDWESGSTRSSSSSHESGSEGATGKRYLQCPALFTVGLIKKFLRSKFELKPQHKVDLYHRRVCLPDDYTIMDVAYIYSWRQTSPMRFFYCFYEAEQHQQDRLRAILSAKKRPSVDVAAAEARPETKTAPKSCPPPPPAAPVVAPAEKKVEVVPQIAPPPKKEERMAVVVTQNENEHPVISIPSPPPSTESTPELDLLDMIDKKLKEETALENNNIEISLEKKVEVTERPKTPPKSQAPVTPTTLSVSISTSPTSTSPTSPAMTSPSKSKIRPPGSGPSILSIASELARKQQEQMEREQSKAALPSVPSTKLSPIMPSARLGKSSLEIKLVPSSAGSKPVGQIIKMDVSKPQTSITLKSNVDKAKVGMDPVLSSVPHAKQPRLGPNPKSTVPPLKKKAPVKRPNQPYKFHNYDGMSVFKEDGAKSQKVMDLFREDKGEGQRIMDLFRAHSDDKQRKMEMFRDDDLKGHKLMEMCRDGAKKQKLEEKMPMAPKSPSKKLYHSATISPFAPVHKSPPLTIPPLPSKHQRPASLSSASSPSPSPPSSDLRHYSPPQPPKKSPTLEPPHSPINSMYNGLLAAAAVARHPNQAAAAALFMRQQLEYQKMYQRHDWSFGSHFMHHSAAANTMKRLSEDYMRSLYPFGPMPNSPTGSSAPLPSSSGNAKS